MTHVIVVAVGGAVGSVARFVIGRAMIGAASSFPWGTLLINAVGCGLLGLLIGLSEARFAVSPEVKAFVSIGLLGGFTTFSLFGLETVSMWQTGRSAAAAGYVVLSVAVALLAVWGGHRLGTAF